MTIRDILKGTEVGRLQTVGYMQVIPLLSDIQDENFVSPIVGGRMASDNYGSMRFHNDTDQVMIIPNQVAYMTKHAAQDHGLPHAGIIGKKSMKTYDTAACIERTQGGHIPLGSYDFVILPFAIREKTLLQRAERSMQKMWEPIATFNRSHDIPDDGHLKKFFHMFDKELEEFVAEFEIVPRQVGAIVLVNGKVMGIERSPSYAYWKSVWNPLVRGCYASLAMEYAKKNVNKTQLEKIRVPMKLENVNTIEDLENALTFVEDKQDTNVRKIVRELVDEGFQENIDEQVDSAQRINVQNNQFVGQIIKNGAKVVYASLVTSKSFDHDWAKAKDFSI